VTRGLGEPKQRNRLEVGSGCRVPAGLSDLGAAGEDESNPKTPQCWRHKQASKQGQLQRVTTATQPATAGSHRSPVRDSPLPVAGWSGAVLLGQGPGAGVAQLLVLGAADVPRHHAPLPAPG